ncbi:MAG: tetratricopeptide repeat protein [Alphaproteobacteria bacterium]|nr:tetratricopeptide repeat protein [Alphaproteobacteria bacterium]
MTDIFREVDEELQQERVAKLWSRYGSWVIAAAVAIVLAVAGNVGWKEWRAQAQAGRAAQYAAAVRLLDQDSPRDAANAFAALAESASNGYATIARLSQAAALAKAGDAEGAVAAYDALVAVGAEEPYAGLARLRAVRLQIGVADSETLRAALAPVLEAGNPWHALARETEAAIALAAGDRDGAVTIFKTLADAPDAPAALRARAAEMVRALGG